MKQIIYFSAKWCTACQATTPIVEQLKKGGSVQVLEVNVDYEASLTEQYNVKSIPTTVILENGVEIRRYVGSINLEGLKSLING
jgi:thioredoxin 1